MQQKGNESVLTCRPGIVWRLIHLVVIITKLAVRFKKAVAKNRQRPQDVDDKKKTHHLTSPEEPSRRIRIGKTGYLRRRGGSHWHLLHTGQPFRREELILSSCIPNTFYRAFSGPNKTAGKPADLRMPEAWVWRSGNAERRAWARPMRVVEL